MSSSRRLLFASLVFIALHSASSTTWSQLFVAPATFSTGSVVSTGVSGTPATATLSGTATISGGAFVFDGSPSASSSSVNALQLTVPETISTAFGSLIIGLNASYSINDNRFRELFNFNGVVGVLHNSDLWLGNNNGGSANCARSFDISAAWPINTLAELQFTVDRDGTISSRCARQWRLAIRYKAGAHAVQRRADVPACSHCGWWCPHRRRLGRHTGGEQLCWGGDEL